MPDDRSFESEPDRRSDRRSFVTRLAGVMAAWPLVRRQVSWRGGSSIERRVAEPNATLIALGDAVLPVALGAAASQRAVVAFERWMDGYRPGAEANHGYGTGKIERLPADPRPEWRSQLAALDAEARRRHGRSFAGASRDERQSIVRAALAAERGDSFPNPLRARHVAVALLAHFYESAEATDLCYEATIGRQQCRPLEAQRQEPVALNRRTR